MNTFDLLQAERPVYIRRNVRSASAQDTTGTNEAHTLCISLSSTMGIPEFDSGIQLSIEKYQQKEKCSRV